MGFIDAAMGDAPETSIAPEGRYDLRVVGKKYGDTNAGDRKKLTLTLDVEDDTDSEYDAVFHTITFPNQKDWDDNKGRTAKMFLQQAKRFLDLFGATWEAGGFDPDQLDGALGENILLNLQRGDDGVDRNQVNLPRIEAGR